MVYYVRKLSKPANLYKIKESSDISQIPADFLGQEMRTQGNTLSVWRCGSIDEVGMSDAIKAALFVSTGIEATQFLILDSDMLSEAGIEVKDVTGKTAYKGLNELHSDLCELTYEKIGVLLNLYHRTSLIEGRMPKIEKAEFQKIALEAYNTDCLDEDEMNEKLLKAIHKVVEKSKVS